MKRAWLIALMLSLTVGMCYAQEDEGDGKAVDGKDPVAVVKAYVAACEKGDVDGALALIAAEKGVLAGLRTMVSEVGRGAGQEGMNFGTLLTEMTFLPLGMAVVASVGTGQDAGEGGIVVAVEDQPLNRQFVLKRAPDGTWKVDLEASIIRTTGLKNSFVIQQMARAGGPGGPATAAQGPDYYQRQSNLRKLASALVAYAQAQGGQLPEADIWLDELEDYCLDRSILHRPGLAEGEYGYAFNVALSGASLPGWNERQKMVLIYESADLGPNAAGDPNEELASADASGGPLLVAFASGEVVGIPRDMTIEELMDAHQHDQTCQQRVRQLCQAIRAYARDNDGLLPEAESWCDDIGPYINPPDTGPEVFECPARPELEYGYAINLQLAGTDIRILKNHERYIVLLPAKYGDPNEAVDVPNAVENAWHISRWNYQQGKHITAGMLDGNTRPINEGQAYPVAPDVQ